MSVSGAAAYAHIVIPLQRYFKKKEKKGVSVSGALYDSKRVSVSGAK